MPTERSTFLSRLHLIASATVALTFFLPSGALADDCRFQAVRTGTVDAAGADRIRIDARAGSLRIEGTPDLRVRAEGEVCASDDDLLERSRLEVARRGDEIVVEVSLPSTGGWSLFGSESVRMDLEVRIPDTVPVFVEDSSGSMTIRNTASLEIEDSSGSIDLRGIRGPISIDDSSGSIDIVDVDGSVRLWDSSGSIDVRDVRGSVVVEDDSSGSIDAEEVTGDVIVRSDSSGSISVRSVGGDFAVLRDGSGGIHYADVGGSVDLPRDR